MSAAQGPALAETVRQRARRLIREIAPGGHALRSSEVASLAGIGIKQLNRETLLGRIRSAQMGRKSTHFYPQAEVERYLAWRWSR